MDRRNVLAVLLANGTLAMLGGCDRMPSSAVEAWRGPADDLHDVRLRAAAWALLAPNPHNMQPWQIDLRVDGELTLLLDTTRLLPATDPEARQIFIGCGAFVELLRMAAAEQRDAVSIEAFPRGVPGPLTTAATVEVARVRWTGERAVADPLFAQVQRRHTAREPYAPAAPSPEVLARLAAAVQTPGIQTQFTVQPERVFALSRLTVEALRVEFGTPSTFAESARVVRLGADEIAANPSGVALHGPKIWWGTRLGLVSRKDLADPQSPGVQDVLDRFIDAVQATPCWAWQISDANDRTSQLAAGRAFVRLALAATADGLSMQPCSQALQEFDEMRSLGTRIHDELGARVSSRVQMFCRLGRAPSSSPAPRRALRTLVLDTPSSAFPSRS